MKVSMQIKLPLSIGSVLVGISSSLHAKSSTLPSLLRFKPGESGYLVIFDASLKFYFNLGGTPFLVINAFENK
jgi:hypothetical protein